MNPEKIKQTIGELLKLLGIVFESVTLTESDGRSAFVIKTRESQLLIGSRGSHLTALNHLIKRIASKNSTTQEGGLDFYVDVNDYHERLLREIKNKAEILAGRARSFKTSVEMDPMSAYERMIVHSFFQGSPDIKTESVGSGDKRRIVIKYVSPEGERF